MLPKKFFEIVLLKNLESLKTNFQRNETKSGLSEKIYCGSAGGGGDTFSNTNRTTEKSIFIQETLLEISVSNFGSLFV